MGRFLGVILAGGESSRFGSPKALAPLWGRPMASWGVKALRSHFDPVVVISNDPATGRALDLPSRGDLEPGMGPLGGLATALDWTREMGMEGAFLLGCDLPLVDGALVGNILAHGFRGRKILVPQSLGPLGLEPLCGMYTSDCQGVAMDLLASGRRSMMGLLDAVGYTLVPSGELGCAEGPSRVFSNVNTPQDAKDIESLLPREEGPSPPILCVIGRKNSGKTTLTVALAAELKRRGRRVMTVKRGHGFELDTPGRDSWRHRHEGGAVRTVLAGPGDFAVMGEWPGEELSLTGMVGRFLWDADIVLAEGFKRSPEPKIEVYRREIHPEPLFGASVGEAGPILALVTDAEGLDLPVRLLPLGEPDSDGLLPPSPSLAALADFVEKTFFPLPEPK